MREEDRAPAGLPVEALENVLEEGVGGPSLRRRAEDVAAPRVVEPRVPVPGLDRIRRIGEHHVERHKAVSLAEGRIAQGVADGDPEVLDAVQHEVHARNGRGRANDLLSVEAERASIAAGALDLRQRRNEHAAGAGRRIVDALARPRPEASGSSGAPVSGWCRYASAILRVFALGTQIRRCQVLAFRAWCTTALLRSTGEGPRCHTIQGDSRSGPALCRSLPRRTRVRMELR